MRDGVALTHFHNDEVNDEHFPFVIELGDVDPAEVVSPSAVVERGDATVIRPDIQSGPSRVLVMADDDKFQLIQFS